MSGDFLFLRSHEDFAFSGYNEPACIFTVFSTEQACEVVPSGKSDVFQRKCQLQISIRRSAVAVVFQRNIQTIKVRTSEVLIDNVLVVGDVVEAAGRECLQIYFAVRMAEKTTLGWMFATSSITRGNTTLAELSTGKIDRRNEHPNACDTYKMK